MSSALNYRHQKVKVLPALQSDPHKRKTTALLLHHIIRQTFMHHRGSTLSLVCFMYWDYKGKFEPNISCWQKNSAHTKLYIFQLKNNYSSSEPFVSVCFVFLTKRGGPFITMNGVRQCEFSLYYTSPYSGTVSITGSLALRQWWFVGYDLWFVVSGKQTCTVWVNFPVCKSVGTL